MISGNDRHMTASMYIIRIEKNVLGCLQVVKKAQCATEVSKRM